jgi:hypothetical protein
MKHVTKTAPANRLPHHDTGDAGSQDGEAGSDADAMREYLNPRVNTSVLPRLDTQIHNTYVDTKMHLCPRVEAYQPNQQGRVG